MRPGPVPRALLTHAHADHAYAGSASYLCASPGVAIARHRLGGADGGVDVAGMPYGEVRRLGDANVSFHPAGHVLGSAQIRIDVGGVVTVVAGDYKRAADPTTPAFEPLRCQVFVTETTFGLPVFTWPAADLVVDELVAAWRAEHAAGATFLVYGYALGKAQRLLASLAERSDLPPEPIFVHGAVANLNQLYENAGVRLAPWEALGDRKGKALAGRLVIAPPHTRGQRLGQAVSGRPHGAALGVLSDPRRTPTRERRPRARPLRPRGLRRAPPHGARDRSHPCADDRSPTRRRSRVISSSAGLFAEAVPTSFVGEGDA